jgi:hypothetical protein
MSCADTGNLGLLRKVSARLDLVRLNESGREVGFSITAPIDQCDLVFNFPFLTGPYLALG